VSTTTCATTCTSPLPGGRAIFGAHVGHMTDSLALPPSPAAPVHLPPGRVWYRGARSGDDPGGARTL